MNTTNTTRAAQNQQNHQQPTTEQATPSAIGHQPLEEVGRQALHFYERRLRKKARALHHDDDAETIHEARVAVRGLRAMMELLEPAPDFAGEDLHRQRKRLGKLARALGAVRDMDVLLEHLASYQEQHAGTSASLYPLRHALRTRRKAARKEVQTLLASKKTKHLLKEVRQQSEQTRQQQRKTAEQPLQVRHFAGSAIWHRYEDILHYEMTLPDAPSETLHKLRIACKQLRYSLRLFESTEPVPAPVSEIAAALKAAQDQLGQLHDLLFTRELLHELPTSSRDASTASAVALAAYDDALASESATLLATTVGALWERLSGLPMRQTLAGFLASL